MKIKSEQLTHDFGKGFDERELRKIRQFYLTFPIRDSLRPELGWTLKMDDLTHQDLGQMQMYVNYYTREMMNEGDNPPIGIILCADKSEAIVRYTLAEDNKQIFASKYMLYLPTEQEFKNEIYAAMGEDKELRIERNAEINVKQ